MAGWYQWIKLAIPVMSGLLALYACTVFLQWLSYRIVKERYIAYLIIK